MKTMQIYYIKNILANTLIFLLPFSFIAGNLSTNLIIIIISLSFFFFKEELFNFKLNSFDKIILFFFFYIFIVLLINYLENFFKNDSMSFFVVKKTFFFFRFLIFYFFLRMLIDNKILNLDLFFISCFCACIFVTFDILIQFSFGKNIFGLSPFSPNHFSGAFGTELIAGGFLQKFGIFGIFFPFIYKILKNINNNKKILIQFTLFIFFSLGIILSGNRMPLILFLFSFFVYLLFSQKNLKLRLNILFFTFFFISVAFFSNNTFKNNIKSFFSNSINIFKTLNEKDFISSEYSKEVSRPYIREFYCGINIAKKNLFFGGGIRSYRNSLAFCSTHPHNYYLEIISDLGVVGLLIILFFVLCIFFKIIQYKLISHIGFKIYPALLIILTEFIPFRSSGSFFTTSNATILFLSFAITISLINNIENKNQIKI